MLNNQPHPLISVLVILVAVLIAYPLATRMTDALRPHMISFLDRRDARKFSGSDFEKEHHLVVRPPVGTTVILVAESSYLRQAHGAVPGHKGTVVGASQLSYDDNGVVVDWGVSQRGGVCMDLHELKLPADS